MTADLHEGGLRERKRRRTRAAIAGAALDLFDRQGFAATTLAQVAAAADVSPRTVSSYFPVKEQLAFARVEDDVAGLRERLAGRRPAETALDALRAWLSERLSDGDRHDGDVVQRRVIAASEELRLYERRFLADFQALMAEAIARDLGAGAGDLEPRMAAASIIAIFEVIGATLDGDDRPAADQLEQAQAALDRALRFVAGGIAALDAAA